MSIERKTPEHPSSEKVNSDGKIYFREWYAENREDLNEKRRLRYAVDAGYREQVQRWNNAARDRRRSRVIEEQFKMDRAVKMGSANSWKTVDIDVDGVRTRMFTIGALAKAIGHGISTIRVWERVGVIPETPYRSKKGDRLYTVEMVEAIREALKKSGKFRFGGSVLIQEKKKPLFVVRQVLFPGVLPVRMRLYKIGTLARAINRTVVAVTQMEKRGVLPRTPLVYSSLSYRLYTLEQIEVVQAAFNKRNGRVRGRSEWDDVHGEILRAWGALGVMEATIVMDDGFVEGVDDENEPGASDPGE